MISELCLILAQLFDLMNDPGELHDLAETHPDLLQLLLEEIDVWDAVAHMYSPEVDAIPLDARSLKKLKSLGYVN